MGHDYDKYDDNCVLDILLDIVEAQEKAEDKNDCVTGCRTSIKELYRGKERAAAHTTIPVSLVCSGTCDYFVGMGVRRNPLADRPGQPDLLAYESCAFRCVDVDPETNCATFELLQPVPCGQAPGATLSKSQFLMNIISDGLRIQNGVDVPAGYTHTGICITLNLDCFCGVICHPAATPATLPSPAPGTPGLP